MWTNLGPIVLDSDTHPDSLCDLPARVPHLHCELAAERAIREYQKWSLKRLHTNKLIWILTRKNSLNLVQQQRSSHNPSCCQSRRKSQDWQLQGVWEIVAGGLLWNKQPHLIPLPSSVLVLVRLQLLRILKLSQGQEANLTS